MSIMYLKVFKFIALSLCVGFVSSCDFADINTDPNSPTSIEPGPLLTYTQMNTATGGITKNIQVGTCMMMVQQTATLKTDMPGDKYYQMDSYANTMFGDTYNGVIKNWRELEVRASSDAKYENMLGVAKIWGMYLFQRLTDLYGDVPFFEAGLGYHNQVYYPKYDRQEDIYKNMIQEVKDGLSLLSADKPKIEGDLFYDGDISKWKKFGGSLLLRLGMRLTKVAPDLAKETVQAAVKNGVMENPEDMCRLVHQDGSKDSFKNPLSLRFLDDKFIENDAIKISKTFMDYLKKTNDPRIEVYCSLKNGDADPAKQFGLPNGYDTKTIPEAGSDFVGLENTSNFNTNTILRMDAPTLFLLPSESKLLLAEAALKGWIASDAATLFNDAVKSSMKEQEIAYGVSIPEAKINNYLSQRLFENATSVEAKLQVIGEQYWIVTFMDGYESYANWRRTGYPRLTPTNYAGNQSNGTIPRRLPYASDEYAINKANIDIAIQNQGADKVTTHIWWDK